MQLLHHAGFKQAVDRNGEMEDIELMKDHAGTTPCKFYVGIHFPNRNVVRNESELTYQDRTVNKSFETANIGTPLCRIQTKGLGEECQFKCHPIRGRRSHLL